MVSGTKFTEEYIVKEIEKIRKKDDLLTSLSPSGILTITLNRPRKMNSVTIPMYLDIAKALNDSNNNDKVRAVFLKGNGKCFCSGNDLMNFTAFPETLESPEVKLINKQNKKMKCYLDKTQICGFYGYLRA